MLDKNKVKLGIAPIAWTNDDMPDLGAENTFEQCISEMALAGFTGCEVGNKYPRDTAVLKKALDLRGMQICNAWFSSFLTTKPYEEVVFYLQYVGKNGRCVLKAFELLHIVESSACAAFLLLGTLKLLKVLFLFFLRVKHEVFHLFAAVPFKKVALLLVGLDAVDD